jgi:prepilin-type N-terminal cleavage/methylation domain-containing protein
MMRARGFTLVELLVVIAIIAILAAIAVPRVSQYLSDAQVTRAIAEIRSIETSVTGILSDAKRRDLRSVLAPSVRQAAHDAFLGGGVNGLQAATNIYTDAMYRILRQGRDAGAAYLDDAVRLKLSTSYLPDLGEDPYGAPYQFYIGPFPRTERMPFRKYRIDEAAMNANDDGLLYPRVYDANFKAELDSRIPGNPPADGAYGIPADTTRTIYVWSMGGDVTNNQGFYPAGAGFEEWYGGGDDINGWDNEAGWDIWY